MKIGDPFINRSLTRGCDCTFRFRYYSETRLTETVQQNLLRLAKMFLFNITRGVT